MSIILQSKYTLSDFNNIILNGFNYQLPETTLQIISKLASEVGSPNYIKTPNFQKKDPLSINNEKINLITKSQPIHLKKKKNSKNVENINDETWETIKSFQTTKLEQKQGVNAQIDLIRSHLNKLTDKNYLDIRPKVFEIIESIPNTDISNVSLIIFDIASTNRFYSKLYADIYSELIKNYEIMREAVNESLSKFSELFNNIQYIDSSVDYDKFCEINKNNEKRKSLATFFLNLTLNNVIPKEKIIQIMIILLSQLNNFILQENKKNEVDELAENISILFKKELYENDKNNYLIEGNTIIEIINKIATSKSKDYKSLTNKTIFKFMDMVGI
jgi:hypothetical protein